MILIDNFVPNSYSYHIIVGTKMYSIQLEFKLFDNWYNENFQSVQYLITY